MMNLFVYWPANGFKWSPFSYERQNRSSPFTLVAKGEDSNVESLLPVLHAPVREEAYANPCSDSGKTEETH